MSAASLIQLIGACIGVVGSLFFAIGVMRQSVEAMGRLSGSYWDSNPHMPKALATQKADYLFGGGLIVVAFALQLTSFLVPANVEAIAESYARWVPWVAVTATAVTFIVLRLVALRVATHYQTEIERWLQQRQSQT